MICINNKQITQKQFAYDGCHKFYLIDNKQEENEAINLGYAVYPIEWIAKEFRFSCPLRFIETWTDFIEIVPQFTDKIIFDIDGKIIEQDFII